MRKPNQNQQLDQFENMQVNAAKQSNANAALDQYFLHLTQSDESPSSKNFVREQAERTAIEEKKRIAEGLLKQANASALSMDEYLQSPIHAINERSTDARVSQNNNANHKEIEHDADTVCTDETRNYRISLQTFLPERFQVLLCKVAGLTIAVPLVELGGIHQLTKLSTIAGKPDWFKGILIKGDVKYQCIDAARWIMPEKVSAEMAKTIDYKFAIQLGKSPYVLCCESVSSTIELSKDEIKWRNDDIKRPWLAGLLKEKMCALIDGARMVQVVLHEGT